MMHDNETCIVQDAAWRKAGKAAVWNLKGKSEKPFKPVHEAGLSIGTVIGWKDARHELGRLGLKADVNTQKSQRHAIDCVTGLDPIPFAPCKPRPSTLNMKFFQNTQYF